MGLRAAMIRSRQLLGSGTRQSKQSLSTTTTSATGSQHSDFSSSSSASSLPSNSSAANPTARKLPLFLKAGLFGVFAGALGAAYATCAYTTNEMDEKTKAFRSSINHFVVDSGPTNDKLKPLYSAVMTAPAKAVDLYLHVRRSIEERLQEFAEPMSDKLLPDMEPVYQQMGVLTLVLDLRETLIHNEWTRETGWVTFKRPGLDAFLEQLSQIFEIVVYTDETFVDLQIQEKLNKKGVFYFLTRPHTKYRDGKHYRDISKLNRNPSKVLYVSGHALETCLQPENCVPIKPWRKEVDDTTLIDLIPFLEFVGMHRPADIRTVLASYHGKDIPSEFIARSREHQRLTMEKKPKALRWGRSSWN